MGTGLNTSVMLRGIRASNPFQLDAFYRRYWDRAVAMAASVAPEGSELEDVAALACADVVHEISRGAIIDESTISGHLRRAVGVAAAAVARADERGTPGPIPIEAAESDPEFVSIVESEMRDPDHAGWWRNLDRPRRIAVLAGSGLAVSIALASVFVNTSSTDEADVDVAAILTPDRDLAPPVETVPPVAGEVPTTTAAAPTNSSIGTLSQAPIAKSFPTWFDVPVPVVVRGERVVADPDVAVREKPVDTTEPTTTRPATTRPPTTTVPTTTTGPTTTVPTTTTGPTTTVPTTTTVPSPNP